MAQLHLLLPPSETKRDGGNASVLDVSTLSFPRLAPVRRKLVNAVAALAKDEAASLRALKLGPKGAPEVVRNKLLKKAPTMSALERYTGVLYDALDAPGLDAAARSRASERVLIHSALFGLLRADDQIPAYRLSHDSRLPDVSLKAVWADKNARELAALPGLLLDLRSEGYVELGPAPERAWFVRVVTRGEGGQVRALNHFNKKAKGEFTRDLLSLEDSPETADELIDAARSLGWKLEPGAAGELNLEV